MAFRTLHRSPANSQRGIFDRNWTQFLISLHFNECFRVFPSVETRHQRHPPRLAQPFPVASLNSRRGEARKSTAPPRDKSALQSGLPTGKKGVEAACPPSTESQRLSSVFFRPGLSMVQQMVIAGMDFTCVVNSLSKYELPGKECFLSLLAKALGYAIVAASTIVKLPQILIIMRTKSIKGLSVPSFEMELIGYTIALSFCLFKQLPFSAFGELLFLCIQAVILVGLLYCYSPQPGRRAWVKAGVYSAMAPVLLSGMLDGAVYERLYAGQTALFTASRIPQIYENFRTRSTGQLSFLTTLMNFAGCLVRLFTSIQENAPMSMIIGTVLGGICHGTIFVQILLYAKSKRNGEDAEPAVDNNQLKKTE